MTVLPIVDRELRVAARHRATWWIRLATATGALVIVGIVAITASRQSRPADLAETMFISLGVLGLLLSLLAGLFLTADCLSSEKREGTLGLLFLTDLKGYDVVLGKLAATSLNTVYCLLALIPAMALPLLIGGVTVGEFLRVSLTMLVTLLLSLSVGMFVSTVSRETRHALLGTLFVLVFIAAVLPALAWILWAMARPAGQLNSAILALNPFHAFVHAFDSAYSGRLGPVAYWTAMGAQGGLGLMLLVAAAVVLPRIWQESGGRSRAGKSGRASSQEPAGFTAWERMRHGARVAGNPMEWLASRGRDGRLMLTVFLGTAWVIWGIFFALCFSSSRNLSQGVGFGGLLITTQVAHLILKALLVVEATRRLSLDRQSGALELLLNTPLSDRSIITGLTRAIKRRARVPLLSLAAMNVLVLWLLWVPDPLRLRREAEPLGWLTLILLAGLAFLLADFSAILWTSLRLSLTQRRHHRAVIGVLLRVLLPPWILLGLLLLMMVSAGGNDETLKGLYVTWLVLCFLADAVWSAMARTAVTQNFRRLASEGASRVLPLNPLTPARPVESSVPSPPASDISTGQ